MNYKNLELSKKYRTIHSINDADIALIDKYIQSNNVKTFLDYGCHLGHLSIYLAKTYNITIYAVDNFTGTIGDDLMQETVKKLTNTNNFYNNTINNIAECEPFLGNIIVQYPNKFFDSDIEFDFAFIDSSHRIEEAEEFPYILSRVKTNGLIGGHDFSQQWYGEGVRKGISLIENDCNWIIKKYTWLMRKK